MRWAPSLVSMRMARACPLITLARQRHIWGQSCNQRLVSRSNAGRRTPPRTVMGCWRPPSAGGGHRRPPSPTPSSNVHQDTNTVEALAGSSGHVPQRPFIPFAKRIQ